jgi:hypothetical protein
LVLISMRSTSLRSQRKIKYPFVSKNLADATGDGRFKA